MGLKFPSFFRDKEVITEIQEMKNVITEIRTLIPDKVFIEREGSNYEYSEEMPGGRFRLQSLINGFYSHQNFIELFYCLPEIFAPIHEIASRVADANWQLKRSYKDSEDMVDYKNDAFNRLFSSPNPTQSFRQFVYESVCYEILTGKQLWFFNRPDYLEDTMENVITWSNLPAGKIKAKLKQNVDPYTATEINDYAEYWFTPNQNGGNRTFPTNQVQCVLNLSMEKRWDINCTMSYLLGADKAIKNLIPVYEARGVIYIKRGALGFIVSKKSDDSGNIALTKAEKEEAQREFNNTYGIIGGRDTVSVTALPVDFIKTAGSIQELQPFDETLADAVAIYATLRVPRHLVPSKDQSTFSNADADMISFYDDVIIPWAQKYAQIWTKAFKLSDTRRYICPDFSHISVLQGKRTENAKVEETMGKVWYQRWTSSVCTLNDWIRATDGNAVTGNPLFDKKIFELSKEELDLLKSYVNLKQNASTTQKDTTTKNNSASDSVQ